MPGQQQDCIFCKILRKEIPSSSVYEDDQCYGFIDIAPKAALHYVFIPKEHFSGALEINEAREKSVGHLARVAAQLAREKGIDSGGFRLILNTNADAGQTVFHLHLHLLGGGKLGPMA
jgi:histidine triad (HIT) family protein